MSEPIDWDQLEQERQARRDAGLPAISVLELIIGEDRIREAVDFYVAHAYRDSTELVLSFLRRFRPLSAMQRCYKIIQSDANRETRRAAISLLTDIADGHALDWIDEFLADPDDWIQQGAINILDQMLFGGGIREYEEAMGKAGRLLTSAETHPNPNVRQGAANLRGDEARRAAKEKAWDDFYESKQNAP